MNITIIGYGKMGREVEKEAQARGHDIILRIDRDNMDDFNSETFLETDVAIEFSTPDTAFDNIVKCAEKGVAVISGTTGWNERIDEIKKIMNDKGGTFLYASNFNIGVNIIFNLNRRLASIMETIPAYDVTVDEIHHIMKKDAPSGTAISLADDIINECKRYESWHPQGKAKSRSLAVNSERTGDVPGTHRITWKSDHDTISLEHKAHSRTGFAVGAVFAAEYIYKKSGVFTMGDLLGF